tara:strand:+ start:2388 stop:2561 length:174 start_codon:yes stop_codon:yes gene_type:complete
MDSSRGSSTAFSAFKVSAQKGLFLEQMTWVKLVFLETRLHLVEQLDMDVDDHGRVNG